MGVCKKKWVLFLAAQSLVACGERTRELANDFKEVFKNPPASISVANELKPYFQAFSRDILKGEKVTGIGAKFGAIKRPAVAMCYVYTDGTRVIEIDQEYWNLATKIQRVTMMYHELGHCFLDLDHNDTLIDLWPYEQVPESIMFPSLLPDILLQQFKEHYFQELGQ